MATRLPRSELCGLQCIWGNTPKESAQNINCRRWRSETVINADRMGKPGSQGRFACGNASVTTSNFGLWKSQRGYSRHFEHKLWYNCQLHDSIRKGRLRAVSSQRDYETIAVEGRAPFVSMVSFVRKLNATLRRKKSYELKRANGLKVSVTMRTSSKLALSTFVDNKWDFL